MNQLLKSNNNLKMIKQFIFFLTLCLFNYKVVYALTIEKEIVTLTNNEIALNSLVQGINLTELEISSLSAKNGLVASYIINTDPENKANIDIFALAKNINFLLNNFSYYFQGRPYKGIFVFNYTIYPTDKNGDLFVLKNSKLTPYFKNELFDNFQCNFNNEYCSSTIVSPMYFSKENKIGIVNETILFSLRKKINQNNIINRPIYFRNTQYTKPVTLMIFCSTNGQIIKEEDINISLQKMQVKYHLNK